MIRADLSTVDNMELVFPEGTLTVPYSTFMGAIPDMTDPVVAQQVADSVRDWIYSEREIRNWDRVIKVNQLPQDDPDRTTDPEQLGEFWRGSGGQKVLVARRYIVRVIWDGERFQYSFASSYPEDIE